SQELFYSKFLNKSIVLKLPVISANMPSITESNMAFAMDKVGGLGIIHRFCAPEEEARMVSWSKTLGANLVGASIGLNDLDRAQKFIEAEADVLCLDIAHGLQTQVYDFVQLFKKRFNDYPLIVGNFSHIPNPFSKILLEN